jgi:hypothetical protein
VPCASTVIEPGSHNDRGLRPGSPADLQREPNGKDCSISNVCKFTGRWALVAEPTTARRAFPTRGDKAVRAQSIRGRMALEGLHYLASAPWRADLEAELLSFPAGRHDDQVDALGLAGQLLDIMTSGDKPKPEEPRRDSWDLAFERADRNDYVSWRVA